MTRVVEALVLPSVVGVLVWPSHIRRDWASWVPSCGKGSGRYGNSHNGWIVCLTLVVMQGREDRSGYTRFGLCGRDDHIRAAGELAEVPGLWLREGHRGHNELWLEHLEQPNAV